MPAHRKLRYCPRRHITALNRPLHTFRMSLPFRANPASPDFSAIYWPADAEITSPRRPMNLTTSKQRSIRQSVQNGHSSEALLRTLQACSGGPRDRSCLRDARHPADWLGDPVALTVTRASTNTMGYVVRPAQDHSNYFCGLHNAVRRLFVCACTTAVVSL
jgi:hypothetical protein